MTSADPGRPADPGPSAGPAGPDRPAEPDGPAGSGRPARPADVGLLSPGWAGSEAEQATSDAAFVTAMLTAEAALTAAQAQLGLAPRSAVAAVRAAAEDRYDAGDLAARARSGGNPVIPLVADLTRAVAERDPDAAAYVHRGATSQDIVDTALMLVAARTLDLVLADCGRTAAHLAELARAHRDTPMAGRTLTQHAVPTTFGLKAAGWRHLVLDAMDRLTAVRRSLPAQLGGAAGTLAAFDAFSPGEERALRLIAAFATHAGLAAPRLPWHTLRTPVADLGAALAFTAGALGKLAADVLVLSRTEIGEVAEGGHGGSSAMPHKQNPVRATLIAACARQVPALAAVLAGSLAAEDERPAGAWHAEWQPLREALRLVGGAARDSAELTGALRVHPDRMRANLDRTAGLIVSERLVAALSAVIPRDAARKALDQAAGRAVAEGLPLVTALAREPALRDVMDEAALRGLADPADYLGAAPALTDRALRRNPPQQEDS